MPQDQDFALFSRELSPEDLPIWRVADGNVPVGEEYEHLPLMACVRRDGKGISHLHILLLVLDTEQAPLGTVLCSQQLSSPLGRIYAASFLAMLGWDGRIWPKDPGYPTDTGMEQGVRDAMGAINAKAAMVFPAGEGDTFKLYPLPVRHSQQPWTLLIKSPILGVKDPMVVKFNEAIKAAQLFGLLPDAPKPGPLTPGRNDLCPCGKRAATSLILPVNGRAPVGERLKYKECHGATKPEAGRVAVVKRNDACPCGKKDERSRRVKYRHCHGDPLAGQRADLERRIAERMAKETAARTTLTPTDQESATGGVMITESAPATGDF